MKSTIVLKAMHPVILDELAITKPLPKPHLVFFLAPKPYRYSPTYLHFLETIFLLKGDQEYLVAAANPVPLPNHQAIRNTFGF